MTITISPQTETLLRQQAQQLGQNADSLADTLLHRTLQEALEDHEETCQAIAEGLADMEAGQTVSLEDARAQWETRKSARHQETQAAA